MGGEVVGGGEQVDGDAAVVGGVGESSMPRWRRQRVRAARSSACTMAERSMHVARSAPAVCGGVVLDADVAG